MLKLFVKHHAKGASKKFFIARLNNLHAIKQTSGLDKYLSMNSFDRAID
jgi:hypothetical protein